MALDPFKPNRELGGEPSDYCAACLCEWRMYQDEQIASRGVVDFGSGVVHAL
ncbi:hypothetical protein MTY66_51990 [Mycolicibacterium sp. TY66]|nr:hypothetical protein MTY66_51990 [Mycolicibacterium sp. TY66]BCJ78784.1 hypothetical protein MTY81_01570 [Mycolicibacterium sp. TY81]